MPDYDHIKSEIDRDQWNTIVSEFEHNTILQTWEWGQIKSLYGWKPAYYIKKGMDGEIEAAALMLTREKHVGKFGAVLKILYVPHGPLLNWQNEVLVQETLDILRGYAIAEKAAFIKIDPQLIRTEGIEENSLTSDVISKDVLEIFKKTGWIASKQQIQFKNTFWIDLKLSEDQLLATMKQKTRYNIRLAERKGVRVRKGTIADLELLYEMYAETSMRDGFIIRPKDYYMKLWQTFMTAGMAVPLIAEVEAIPISALFLFHFDKKVYYLYGMSREMHREKMPNYLLQWEAIKMSKSMGCTVYDLWGAPDHFDPSDRMWGVYKFKEGLGGKVIQTVGAYDYPTSIIAYTIIQKVLPKLQRIARKIRGKQIRDELAD